MGNQYSTPLAKDFFENSEPVPFCGCFIWMRATDPDGYGELKVNGRKEKAHRRAWALEYGDIPINLHVLHSCDTPSCVNPRHLFLGTEVDNQLDKLKKGRESHAIGETNGQSKLSNLVVEEIRRRVANGRLNYAMVGREFGVSRTAIRYAIERKTWKMT